MKTRDWLAIFCASLFLTLVLNPIYTGMSYQDSGKSPVFTLLLVSGITWLVSGLALVWRSIPKKEDPGKGPQKYSSDRQYSRQEAGDIRLTTIHWAGLLIACLIGYPLFLFLGLPGCLGYCLFNGGIAILGIVASFTGPVAT